MKKRKKNLKTLFLDLICHYCDEELILVCISFSDEVNSKVMRKDWKTCKTCIITAIIIQNRNLEKEEKSRIETISSSEEF
jgi:hypothetical protein